MKSFLVGCTIAVLFSVQLAAQVPVVTVSAVPTTTINPNPPENEPIPRRTRIVRWWGSGTETPWPPLSGWFVRDLGLPTQAWHIKITAAPEAPWYDAGWVATTRAQMGKFPVHIWRLRQSPLGVWCHVATLMAPAAPGASMEADIDMSRFADGDLMMVDAHNWFDTDISVDGTVKTTLTHKPSSGWASTPYPALFTLTVGCQ